MSTQTDPFKFVEKILTTRTGPSLTFMEVHVLEAIEIMGKEESIGRIKLSKELGLGEGAVRTLLKHLKKQGLVTVTPKLGCKLTKNGRKIYEIIKSKIAGPLEIPKTSITLGIYNMGVLVRKAANVVGYGLEQRDAAIKVGASGATTLVYKNSLLTMPGIEENCFKDALNVKEMLISNFSPQEDDVIIIGSADDKATAKLGAKAAAFETLKMLYRKSS